jgi:hypothetical protein
LAWVAEEAVQAAKKHLAADFSDVRIAGQHTDVTVDASLANVLTDTDLCQMLHLQPRELVEGTQLYEALAVNFLFDHGRHVRMVRFKCKSCQAFRASETSSCCMAVTDFAPL